LREEGQNWKGFERALTGLKCRQKGDGGGSKGSKTQNMEQGQTPREDEKCSFGKG